MKKILCLGDSNTWGFDPRGFGGGRYEHPWPELLETKLLESAGSKAEAETDSDAEQACKAKAETNRHAGKTEVKIDSDAEREDRSENIQVVNLGRNGRELPAHERQQQLLDSLLEPELPADWLIILLGTNDLLNLNGDVLGKVRDRMERWTAHLREKYPEQRILWMTPPPCPELELWDPHMLAQVVPDYRRLAEKYEMEFLNLSEEALDLAYDGVHLSEEGHRQLAELVYSHLGCGTLFV